MFPRRVQPALDRWVAGELTEQAFLKQSEWAEVWNYDPALYLPIFHFARMNRVPMLALNVDRQLTSLVREKGWEAVPEQMRAGISDPAPPSQAYLEFLSQAFQAHRPHTSGDGTAAGFDFNAPEFRRFVQSQQVWDRAMAEAIASVAQKSAPPLVVGIMGAGHILNRFGVPRQLDALGISNMAVLLPWDVERDCNELTPDLADGIFGVSALMETAPHKPRLGLIIGQTARGIEVKELQQGSIAEAAGIHAQDIITEVAGIRIEDGNELSTLVQRQAPGTWLPIKLNREGHELEVIAKFPVQQ
jgi:membrane-associated protease RseP (regulator of RpoE activity)